ncbi:MAG: hypothetical protein A2762_00530 [Candidatus Lloydbacteria bacterium RIFCSPHIGHO2_01_FULL_54_11]|nr:MAG: hypothetical protein A2762_00530 [Candidatus Lloydbacteria bacterium RIFCSPHIGHO2_01_FULL_54_11]OGZ14744.1 MAG: hypothetical protein A2948_04585 [Candidatus Lloydbacteria bacterium RIFCSPLOWO2_01_FULL_54_18]OGZ14792.1 MAG: hypothetical protein A3H76_07015 [Candidatus Lloydbacteria bacterium RIFCSPLOWO2_02_FULL_54_12]
MATKCFFFCYRALRFLALRLLPRTLIDPRRAANMLLRRYAPEFSGDIVNVSGWDDRDGEGGYYRDYFTNKKRYVVTNAPTDIKGVGSMAGSAVLEFGLDLERPLPPEFAGKFDVVLNISTLEHVQNIEEAFKSICMMSRDALVVVIPSIQQIHIADYGDYWRLTPLGLAKLLQKNGFTPLVIKANDQPFNPIYTFALGVRDAEKYKEKIPTAIDLQMGAALFGSSLKERFVAQLLKQ